MSNVDKHMMRKELVELMMVATAMKDKSDKLGQEPTAEYNRLKDMIDKLIGELETA